MNKSLLLAVLALCLVPLALAAAGKGHVITWGTWSSAKVTDASGQKPIPIRIRPLFVDGRLSEFTTGAAHEITDRLFTVQRAFRVNDTLPQEKVPRWQWQRGTWLLVDRANGRVSPINLPDFDPFYSAATWYRDYVAYCGLSEDGKQVFAMVAQLGRRKPLLKKVLAESGALGAREPACSDPVWEREPARVTFAVGESQKFVFTVRGRMLEPVSDEEEAEE